MDSQWDAFKYQNFGRSLLSLSGHLGPSLLCNPSEEALSEETLSVERLLLMRGTF